MFDRLATEEELERLILLVHDNLGMRAPAVVFRVPPGSKNGEGKEYGEKISVGEYVHDGKMKTIYLPTREWCEEYQIFHEPSCYVVIALHECVHSTTKESRHSVDFFFNLFCLAAEYGPGMKNLNSRALGAFLMRCYRDEFLYHPKQVGKAWNQFWQTMMEDK